MPIGSSFWVDEMGSVFVVHHGSGDPSMRDVPQVADSIYYRLPAIAEKVAGLSEASYRFFSVLAMAGSLWAIYKIAIRLFQPAAGWFVVFACLTSRGFNFEADDARPYALGTVVLSLALLSLVRWLDAGHWRDAILFALLAATLWWVHLVFWPFYLMFLFYAGWRLRSGEHKAAPAQLLLAAALVIAACVPVALRSLTLLHSAQSHVVVPPPSFNELLQELKLGIVTGACTCAALLARWLHWEEPDQRAGRFVTGSAVVFILTWWLLDPLVLFVFSKATHTSLFVTRYMYLALPGVAFTACLVTSVFVPARLWKPLAALVGVGVLVFAGHWNKLWPPHQNSDWRTGSQTLYRWAGASDVPVVCPSPFVEARPPVWTPQYPVSGFLYSHLAVYPMAGRVYPFPFETSTEATAYARRLTTETLVGAGRFAVYGGDRSVGYWRDWFAAQPEFSQWTNTVLGRYGDVELVAFNRTPQPRP